MNIRRLPVYLLLDCSESMAGEAFAGVKQGLASLLTELKSNPMALETAWMSLITFGTRAQQLVPLTDILQFSTPSLRLGSGTALGAALELWEKCMAREIVKTSETQKGDYKPVCFIMTDGVPTDSWETAADRIRTQFLGKKANIIALACGPDSDTGALRRITETVLQMQDANAAGFKKFFQWISSSISTASQRLGGDGEKGIGLPALPDALSMAGPEKQNAGVADERYVFLHARCVKSKQFYLLRFAKTSGSGKSAKYKGVAAHPLEDFDFGEKGEIPTLGVSNQALENPTPCPYCGNPGWAMCSSGHVLCCPPVEGTLNLTCPWCSKTEQYQSAVFDVGRGAG